MAKYNPTSLERAVLVSLQTLPTTWQRLDWNSLTASEQKAFRILLRGGLAEQRYHVKASMDGFPEVAFMQFRIQGGTIRLDRETGCNDLAPNILQAVPSWFDSEGRARGQYHWSVSSFIELRLTAEGQHAREDMKKDGGYLVLNWLKNTECSCHPPRIITEFCKFHPKRNTSQASQQEASAKKRKGKRGRKTKLPRNLAWLEEFESYGEGGITEAKFAEKKGVRRDTMHRALKQAREAHDAGFVE